MVEGVDHNMQEVYQQIALEILSLASKLNNQQILISIAGYLV
jgi:hypothetical protein